MPLYSAVRSEAVSHDRRLRVESGHMRPPSPPRSECGNHKDYY
jgi:hypothetical protein